MSDFYKVAIRSYNEEERGTTYVLDILPDTILADADGNPLAFSALLALADEEATRGAKPDASTS